ncbi:hypothetical protein [Neptunitalea lumnitzerae]|uniref:Uncharacterized protein n=1 Tax=Neptunitalea lumnitzerae TaxID=2965509 RepID=A0ABQ5MIR3_9FLAO|nr:hypothetical protein [Neptunitalea sp. Y10]GLB49273.1 hypothetical protein Y10_16410 [Neptunitalea sp. Y10]
MVEITKILEKQSVSFDDLLACFEQVKENGDVAVIKFDGERVENQYTVFISFPQNENKSMIRADSDDLKDALSNVLKSYVN